MDSREILDEIDITLDQLNENAEALNGIHSDPSYEAETNALKKTQESLLAHLIHLQGHLNRKVTPDLKEKLPEFKLLSPSLKKMKASFPIKQRIKKRIKSLNPF